MEGVEEAHRAAVESCHRVLNIITQPQDQTNNSRNVSHARGLWGDSDVAVLPLRMMVPRGAQKPLDQSQYGNLAAETQQAVTKFKRVVSLLSNELGHGRARIVKRNRKNHFPQSFLETLNDPKIEQKNQPVKNCLSLGSNLSLELSSSGKTPLQNAHATSIAHYQFLRDQQQKLQLQNLKHRSEMLYRRSNSSINLNFDSSMSSTRSFASSLCIDGSVASLDGSGFSLIGGSRSSDQNSSQTKKRCSGKGEDGSVKCGSGGRCHCSKKRKNRIKRSIKVPAVSNKQADIPSDDYSWRKYGQKPIKGSPHPRGYYKCSSTRGCPARKHVERCLEEPSMLIVTYESEHNHPRIPSQSTNP